MCQGRPGVRLLWSCYATNRLTRPGGEGDIQNTNPTRHRYQPQNWLFHLLLYYYYYIGVENNNHVDMMSTRSICLPTNHASNFGFIIITPKIPFSFIYPWLESLFLATVTQLNWIPMYGCLSICFRIREYPFPFYKAILSVTQLNWHWLW